MAIKKKKTMKPRVQLELARKLWQRPYPTTVRFVREEMRQKREAMLLTRDELEVLDILCSTMERSFQGSWGGVG